MHSGPDAVVRYHDGAAWVASSVPLQPVDEGDVLALWDSQGPDLDELAVLGQDQASGPGRCGRMRDGNLQSVLDLVLALSHWRERPGR